MIFSKADYIVQFLVSKANNYKLYKYCKQTRWPIRVHLKFQQPNLSPIIVGTTVCMISGFNIVVSTSLHILKDWPCVLKVTCLSLPGFGTFRVTDCERCRLEGGFIKITSLKAENEQMKGKLNKRIEQMEDRYDKFRNMANVCPRGYLFVTSRVWDLSGH
jgi:hypothetical protein